MSDLLPPPDLTPRQWEVLHAALQMVRDGECLSSSRLAEVLGLARQNLRDHLLALARAGYMAYESRARQTTLLALTARARALMPGGYPLLGEVAAGAPILAEGGQVESMVSSLDDVLPMREGDFLLRVRGQSMTGLGIFPGDIVAIRPADTAQNGDVALILVPGENTATLKRWQRAGTAVTLHSENPAFEAMRFAASEVQVQGVLVGHIGLGGARRGSRT